MPWRGEAAAVFVREAFTQEAPIAGVITAAASAPQPLELLPSARQ